MSKITAQVTEHVYDTPTGKFLLIPQGSRRIGQYDSQISFGQKRVLLVWNRIMLPDGKSIVLERQQGADARGCLSAPVVLERGPQLFDERASRFDDRLPSCDFRSEECPVDLSGRALLGNGFRTKVGKTGDYVRILQAALQRVIQLIQCVFGRAGGCIETVPYADFEILEVGLARCGNVQQRFQPRRRRDCEGLNLWPSAAALATCPAPRTADVFDQNRRLQRSRHRFGDEPPDDIGRTSCRVRHDDRDRPAW